MRPRFHPEATQELEHSADWYAQRSEAAARNFLVAVDGELNNIVADPSRFPWIDNHHQACGVHGFPFQIVFKQMDDLVYVIAVAHAKRRAGYWKTR